MSKEITKILFTHFFHCIDVMDLLHTCTAKHEGSESEPFVAEKAFV